MPIVDAACDQTLGRRLARADVIEAALHGALAAQPAQPEADLEAEAKRLREERERVAIAYERGLRSLPDAERRTREIDAQLGRLARAGRIEAPPEESVEELAALLAQPFAEWAYLTVAQKRRILAAAVEWVRVVRTGRSQAAVEAIRLRIPSGGPPTPQIGPRRATWRAWGGGVEVVAAGSPL